MIRTFTFALLLVASLSAAHAIQDVELRDSADEPRFTELSNVLRCMVCQNQTIADSNAALARDFRNQVKQKINQGQSNQQIIEYMTQRYGDYILYRPPFNAATILLWTGPFIFVFIGLIIIMRILRRRDRAEDEASESMAVKQTRLKKMLAADASEDEAE